MPRAAKSILIVDDDENARLLLRGLLAPEGYGIDTAANGQEALDRLHQGPRPDLILLDLAMPVMDGWQFSRALQQDPGLAAIPLVVVSGVNDAQEKVAGLGAVGLLTKPIALEQLLAAVRRHAPAQRAGILIVDDEPGVRGLLELALNGDGFHVHQAGSGQEAVEVYSRHAADIGLVLLDVRMPGLDGPGTLSALRAINPQLTCCFMSGHTGDYTAQQLLDLGAAQVFQKPLGLADLVAALRKLLADQPG